MNESKRTVPLLRDRRGEKRESRPKQKNGGGHFRRKRAKDA